MKVSEITVADVAEYLRLEEGEYSEVQLNVILEAAKEYVADYTGIPQMEEGIEGKTLDDYKKFPLAVYVLCQDMYDNRSMYVDKNNVNKTIQSILNMHCINLL